MAARDFEPPQGTNAIVLKDLENAAALADEFGVSLTMAQTAAIALPPAQGRRQGREGSGGAGRSAGREGLSGAAAQRQAQTGCSRCATRVARPCTQTSMNW